MSIRRLSRTLTPLLCMKCTWSRASLNRSDSVVSLRLNSQGRQNYIRLTNLRDICQPTQWVESMIQDTMSCKTWSGTSYKIAILNSQCRKACWNRCLVPCLILHSFCTGKSEQLRFRTRPPQAFIAGRDKADIAAIADI